VSTSEEAAVTTLLVALAVLGLWAALSFGGWLLYRRSPAGRLERAARDLRELRDAFVSVNHAISELHWEARHVRETLR
jgi:hypothetical protein